ncbi:hypothetical protein N7539_000484 [Penicillium diatomitis]|uniref:DNA polymerase eta n=1 Tax=Penicillium diatomitis TaxID=2819901 RepID=A0A9X0C283_9EURO|nr:uncharacterized protein N7539_000484 [Penicillium diatomitis]KAJ5495368.1 hypothetical protein N7539_000484 [Penicillium diatomitis]
MSSESQPNASPHDAVKRSRFTHRQLHLLRQGSTATPLRAIAHIDLDAFYAQCEMVRLGTPRDTPLAVQQWGSLIAVNYAARPFGVTRMITAPEARKACPNIVLQHVATFREGEGGKWAYRDDSSMNISTDKVSLDPYRAESRKILKTMKEALEQWCTTESDGDTYRYTQGLSAALEKASIDEVFIDLSPLVYSVLLQRYPELRPGLQEENRDWHPEDCLVDLDLHEREEDDPDWDDIVMLVGSEIVRAVRQAVWDVLHYTCSAGLARNKMLAKLGSACNKPDKQTVVRNRAVQHFLGGYRFTQIRMLGGKLGDQITSFFGTEKVSELLNVPLEQLRAKLDDHTASWLYGIIRGEDRSEVNSRTQIKSMLSAKSFRPSINTLEQAEKWLHIFAADIYGRLVEDGVLENRRRPKVITLHHRTAQTRSRQIPIPASNIIDESLLFELARTLMRQVMTDGQPWPCSNLSLSVSSFEDGVTKNKAIEGFLVRGDQAKHLNQNSRPRDSPPTLSDSIPMGKRRKIEDDGIKRFFAQPARTDRTVGGPDFPSPHNSGFSGDLVPPAKVSEIEDESSSIPQYKCDRCSRSICELEREEHEDWHFAKDLEIQDRQEARDMQHQPSNPNPNASRGSASTRGRGGRGKPERGQMRLAF